MWRSVANQKMIAFTIKACHDAHILLAKTRGKNDSDIYEFVIGGWHNSRSVIRKKVAGEFSEYLVLNLPLYLCNSKPNQ